MRSKDRPFTQIKAFLSLFWVTIFIDDLVEVDFQKELSSNKGLASSQDLQKDKFRQDLRQTAIERAKFLRKRLVSSLLWILSACCIAFLIMSLLSVGVCAYSALTWSNIFAIFSIISFSWATLGRLGWEGQSWKGDTVFEQLDYSIFWILYWLGTLFGILVFLP